MSHKYTPTAIAANDRPTAQAPALGGNKRIYFSHVNLSLVASLTLGANAGSVVFADNASHALASPYPDYLAMRIKKRLVGTGSTGEWPTVTLDMTDDGDLSITRQFTFQAPAFVNDQSRNFLPGQAVDSSAPAGSELIKALDGTVSAQNYVPEGAELEVWELPDRSADWIQLGCVDSVQYPLPHPNSVSIPCGMNATAFTASGRTPEKTLSISTKFFNSAETRVWGNRGSMMIEVLKDNLVIERQVFSGVYLTPSLDMPDGEDVVQMSIEGKYEDVLIFSAL